MCNSCYTERQKRYSKKRQANPQALRKQREYRIVRDYGIDMDTYEHLMSTSPCCEICNFVPENTTKVNKQNRHKQLVYDHCHTSGKFRGVLCDTCNTALGKLGDTTESLQKALNYLLRSKYKSMEK